MIAHVFQRYPENFTFKLFIFFKLEYISLGTAFFQKNRHSEETQLNCACFEHWIYNNGFKWMLSFIANDIFRKN